MFSKTRYVNCVENDKNVKIHSTNCDNLFDVPTIHYIYISFRIECKVVYFYYTKTILY